jgi:hypothetical protein
MGSAGIALNLFKTMSGHLVGLLPTFDVVIDFSDFV